MDSLVGLNIFLGVVWATAYTYLYWQYKIIISERIILDKDYDDIMGSIHRIRTIWALLGKIVTIHLNSPNLPSMDKEEINNLFNKMSDTLEAMELRENGK